MEGATMHDTRQTPEHDPADHERAQAAVEFALILPILCLVLFGALEFGTAFWRFQQLSAAASEGARRAAVSRTSATRTSEIQTAVQNASPGLTAGSIGISTTSTWDPGDPVTVTLTYPEDITVMGFEFFSSNLSSSRTARVEN